tara:strand:+ start:11815 stop:12051 length:237 start_codon:yes stop_codon:yes gene_type:complete
MDKKELPKQKTMYDVKVECLLPATLVYRVLALDPNEAVALIKGRQPNEVRHRLIGKRDIKLMVYDAGCAIIKLILNKW